MVVWLQQLWPCSPMVPLCPYGSLVPSNASKSLVKLHALVARGALPFSRVRSAFLLGLKPPNMKNKHSNLKKKKFKKIAPDAKGEKIHPNACGIDIGARELFVCVPSDRDKNSVRRFGTKTPDLATSTVLSNTGMSTSEPAWRNTKGKTRTGK